MSAANKNPMTGLREARDAFRQGKLDKTAYIKAVHAHHRRLFDYPEFLRDSDVAEVRIRQDEVTVVSKSTGVELLLDPNDEHLTPMTLLNFGKYEMQELAFVQKLVPATGVMLDIGANVGWYSIQVARAAPEAQIFAFEPMEHTCAMLRRNLELNEVANVEVIGEGVSEQAGEQTFYYTEQCSGATSMEEVPHLANQKEVRCNVTTVDRFVSERGIAPSFIKCDVEGAEMLVIRGAIDTLRTHKPALLLEMLRKWSAKFDYHPNDLIGLLKGLGYACFSIDGQRLIPFERMNDDTTETNFIFLHESQRDTISSGGLG